MVTERQQGAAAAITVGKAWVETAGPQATWGGWQVETFTRRSHP